MTYDLYKKYGEMRLLDTPICGARRGWTLRPPCCMTLSSPCGAFLTLACRIPSFAERFCGGRHGCS